MRKYLRAKPRSVLLAGVLLPLSITGMCQEVPLRTEAAEGQEIAEKQVFVDSGYDFISGGSSSLVQWIDGFFGVPRSDLESAESHLRLRIDHEWDEKRGSSFGQRLRGKVVLPNINKRLGLLFSDEGGDESSDKNALQKELNENNSSNNVALQYTSIDGDHARLDYRVGFRSSLQIKLAARYRYELALNDSLKIRLSEEIYFRDGQGFGEKTGFDLDKIIDNNEVLRWSTQAEFGQETEGVNWRSAVSWSRKIGEKSAISYFTNVEGSTRPNYTNQAYGLGLTYRRNWWREWLFFELEPVYQWRREKIEPLGQTSYFEGREGVAQFTARFEIHFVND